MDSFAIGRALDLVEEVDAAAKNAPQNIFSVASNFWETIFTGRGRDPDLNAFLNLLNPATNATLGTMARFDPTAVRLNLDRLVGYCDLEYAATFPVPLTGNPVFGLLGNMPMTFAHLCKIYSCQILENAFKKIRSTEPRKLRFAEIGGGFGSLAAMTLAKGIASSYTGIDLHGNLRNAAFYLATSYPTLSVKVIGPGGVADAAINLCLPNYIDALQGKFDLIANEASIAEMEKTTAAAYLDWIDAHLADNGLFLFFNGRARSGNKALTQRQSDYRLSRFRAVHVGPHIARGGLGNDSAIIFVGTKNKSGRTDPAFDHILDILNQLGEIGISRDILDIYEALPNMALDASQKQFLDAADALFSRGDLVALEAIVQNQSGRYNMPANYLMGCAQYVAGDLKQGKALLERFFVAGTSPVALAFTAAVFRAAGFSVGAADPLSFLASRLTVETHWPSLLQAPMPKRVVYRMIAQRLWYPWCRTELSRNFFARVMRRLRGR